MCVTVCDCVCDCVRVRVSDTRARARTHTLQINGLTTILNAAGAPVPLEDSQKALMIDPGCCQEELPIVYMPEVGVQWSAVECSEVSEVSEAIELMSV